MKKNYLSAVSAATLTIVCSSIALGLDNTPASTNAPSNSPVNTPSVNNTVNSQGTYPVSPGRVNRNVNPSLDAQTYDSRTNTRGTNGAITRGTSNLPTTTNSTTTNTNNTPTDTSGSATISNQRNTTGMSFRTRNPDGTFRNQTTTESVLSNRIRTDLRTDTALSPQAQNVVIENSNGQITLRGQVNSSSEEQSLLSKVRSMSGVGSVTSQLTVVMPADPDDMDADIDNSRTR